MPLRWMMPMTLVLALHSPLKPIDEMKTQRCKLFATGSLMSQSCIVLFQLQLVAVVSSMIVIATVVGSDCVFIDLLTSFI